MLPGSTLNELFDGLLNRARSIDTDVKEIISNLSSGAAPLSTSARREFLEKSMERCAAIDNTLASIEKRIVPWVFAETMRSLTKEARELRQSACKYQDYLQKYGYVPERVQVVQNSEAARDESQDIERENSPVSAQSSAPGEAVHRAASAPAVNDILTRNDFDDDPPSPTLESLGISSFGMGILEGAQPDSDDGRSTLTPLSTRSMFARKSVVSTSSTGEPSPAVPEITKTPSQPMSRGADPNSMFGGYVADITEAEYHQLPEYLTAQLSFDYLNEAVAEINELVTDKRFMSRKTARTNELSLEELSNSGIGQDNVKPVVVALLQLGRFRRDDNKNGLFHLSC